MEKTLTKIEFPTQIVKQGRKQLPEALKPFMFKKGVSGNPKGRPKGKSLKEFTRNYFAYMTDRERIEFLNSLKPEFIWQMAEGAPRSSVDIQEEEQIPNPYETMPIEEKIETVKTILAAYEEELKESTNQLQSQAL